MICLSGVEEMVRVMDSAKMNLTETTFNDFLDLSEAENIALSDEYEYNIKIGL